MIKRYFLHPTYTLFLILVFFASRIGQTKAQMHEVASESQNLSTREPKIVKTQGTNEYANIHCGLMDRAGNLWFGTSGEGVYRYDGKYFTNFTEKDGLSSNTVWSILEDKDGNIWVGTDAGLCRFDLSVFTKDGVTIRSETMRSIALPTINSSNLYPLNLSKNKTSVKNGVWSMLQDKTGKLWFGTDEGVYYYNGKSFFSFLDNDSVINNSGLSLKNIQCMLQDKNGNIWFGSGPMMFEGICRYNPATRVLTQFKPGGEGWIRYMLEDQNGIIWLGTRHRGIWRYDPLMDSSQTNEELIAGSETFTPFMEGDDIGFAALLDKNGNIWFSGGEDKNGYGGAGGIWRYDGKSFKNFTTKDGLGDYSVWCFVEDRAGDIWVGTRNIGLYRYDPEHKTGSRAFTSFSE